LEFDLIQLRTSSVLDGLKFRPIIGLEIHVQLLTKTKLFCGCAVRTDAPPNSCVCPVCLGYPGSLPVLNRRAFELGLLTGMALNGAIAPFTKWDRKSYYYPDLPKNYQISQYDLPLVGAGHFEFPLDGDMRRVRIRRAHLEEDAGKNIHDASGCTLVDLNRTGTPLLEIVTEPDLASADEAYAFCIELQRLVTYLGVSEANMQKGQMRFEPNVNVAINTDGKEHRTPIIEIKNLNSFRSVRDAIAYEIDRQVTQWQADPGYVIGQAPNENRGWNQDRGITEFQRGKEAAQDYRYFPDPDLVPVEVSDEILDDIRAHFPELPIARRARFVRDFGLFEKDAETIVGHRPTADLFEQVIERILESVPESKTTPPDDARGAVEVITKQFVNVWLKLANDRGCSVTDLGIDATRMAELARIAHDGTVNKTAANQLAEVMITRPEPPAKLAEELGLIQVQDLAATQAWIDAAFNDNAAALQDAITNPKKAKAAAGFLRGQVMKVSGGQADPKLVGQLIEQRLAELSRPQ
jgi:aspartyl-tRNA(Asn)/glutamyl-tRNA(Gln) amidotransferase subunit B